MLTVLALVLCAEPAAGAEHGYEDRLVAWALEQQQRELEPAPEGKKIEEILVSAEEIITPGDFFPRLLNYLHMRTREPRIRQEVLNVPGDTWDSKQIAENERILRRMVIFSIARIVPVKGRAGGVALLVITQDRWSLRLESNFNVVGDILQLLQLGLSEQNFLGRNQHLAVNFLLKLDTIAFTESFEEPRMFGSRIDFLELATLIVNRQTGKPEGTSGQVSVGRPLVTLDQSWGFSVDGSWNLRTRRTFCGSRVCQLSSEDSATKVPVVYDVRNFGLQAELTRSFGREWKLDITGALGGYSHLYGPTPGANLTADQYALLQDRVLPRSEDATYVLGYFRAYRAEFKVLKNIDTFELSEDYQVGPLFQVGVRYAVPLAPTLVHFAELGSAIRYRWVTGDNVVTATLAGGIRLVPGGTAVNRHVAAEVVEITPPFEGGRFVARALIDVIDHDLDNRLVLLGGGNGLRGAPAEELSGKNLLLGNFEYRTRPFELRTMFVGMVLFYDVGSAFTSKVELTHTIGIGLRILVPQWNFVPVRIDLGFVIGNNGNSPVDRFSASYGQVTDLRPDFLDQPL